MRNPEPTRLSNFDIRKADLFLPPIFYLLVAILATWPLASHLDDALPGAEEARPHALLMVWTMAWNLHRPFASFEDWSHANILWPQRHAIANQELAIGEAVLGWPAWRMTGSFVAAYNSVFIMAFWLCGWSMHFAARRFGASRAAAVFAGLAFMLAPVRTAQLRHLHILSAQFLPLIVLLAHATLTRGKARHGLLLALALAGQGLCCGSQYLLACLVVGFAILTAGPCLGASLRARALACGATAASGLLLWPFYRFHGEVNRLYGFARTVQETIFYSASLENYLASSTYSRLVSWSRGLFGGYDVEWQLLPGFMVLALAFAETVRQRGGGEPQRRRAIHSISVMIGLITMLAFSWHCLGWGGVPLKNRFALASLSTIVYGAGSLALLWTRRWWRPAPGTEAAGTRWCVVMAALALAFSLGPLVCFLGKVGARAWAIGPEALLLMIPPFSSVRVPARLAVFVLIFLLIPATRYFDRLRLSFRVLAFATLLAEVWISPLPLTALPLSPQAPVLDWIKSLPDTAIVAVKTEGVIEAEAAATYAATFHWRRIVNGYTGYTTAEYDRLQALLHEFPSDTAARELARRGVTAVVVDLAVASPAQRDDLVAAARAITGARDPVHAAWSDSRHLGFVLAPSADSRMPIPR